MNDTDIASLLRDAVADAQVDLEPIIDMAIRRGRRRIALRRAGAGLAVTAVVAALAVGLGSLTGGTSTGTALQPAAGGGTSTALGAAATPLAAGDTVMLPSGLVARVATSAAELTMDADEAPVTVPGGSTSTAPVTVPDHTWIGTFTVPLSLFVGDTLTLPGDLTARVLSVGGTGHLLLVLPSGATRADIAWAQQTYPDVAVLVRTTGLAAPGDDSSAAPGDDSSAAPGDDSSAAPETKPAEVTLTGWTCGDAADEKFLCTGPDGEQTELTWYPASAYADWTGGDPDKTADWVSAVHDGVFIVIRGPQAAALGASLAWQRP